MARRGCGDSLLAKTAVVNKNPPARPGGGNTRCILRRKHETSNKIAMYDLHSNLMYFEKECLFLLTAHRWAFRPVGEPGAQRAEGECRRGTGRVTERRRGATGGAGGAHGPGPLSLPGREGGRGGDRTGHRLTFRHLGSTLPRARGGFTSRRGDSKRRRRGWS